MPTCVAIPVEESSQVGEARRVAASLADRIGFDQEGRGRVALMVTEAARNLVKHADGGGQVVLRALNRGESVGLEILALDRGPGMADPGRCLDDGYSTAGTPGTGLGAIVRIADTFDIHSLPGVGTALLARLWSGAAPAGQPRGGDPTLEVGAVCVPLAGESACGDAWAADERDGRSRVVVADGLGHGPVAASAAVAALRAFHEETGGPAEVLRAAHAALRSTRGASVAVAEIDPARSEVRFAGVGNIASSIVIEGGSRSTISHNGTVGHEARKIQEYTYPWEAGSLLILHSDGLATQWRLDRYPGLSFRDPSLVAGVLFRDFRRVRDDATVLVARDRGTESA